MATPRVVASLASAGSAIRTRIELQREEARETIRDVKSPDLWAALKELLVLKSLHEREGAEALDLTLDQAVVNRALAAPAVQKVLEDNRLRSVEVEFTPPGIVLGVVAQLGPLRLPRRQYTLGLTARRGRLEIDLTDVLGIPIIGSKIAAMLDAKAEDLDWLSIRRRDGLVTIAYPQLRCERAVAEDGTLDVTLSAAAQPPRRGARPRPRQA